MPTNEGPVHFVHWVHCDRGLCAREIDREEGKVRQAGAAICLHIRARSGSLHHSITPPLYSPLSTGPHSHWGRAVAQAHSAEPG